MINLFNVDYDDEIKKITCDIFDSGMVANGEYVSLLENSISDLLNGKHAVSVNDMTNGLSIVLDVLGVVEGDEVIVSPFSCLATTSPLATKGIIPVWADLDPTTLSVRVDEIAKLVTSKTKAILVYHVAGYPADVREIKDFCTKNSLYLIEDCNSAFGSRLDNTLLGSWGDAAIFSFYPNRQIGSIDGGCIAFSSFEHAVVARKRRRFGVDFMGFRKNNGEINESKDVETYGYSYNINNISAAIAYYKLKSNFEQRTIQTIENFKRMLDSLSHSFEKGCGSVVSPISGAIVNGWVLFIHVDRKEEFIANMKMHGVSVSSLHMRNDRYSCFNSSKRILPGIDKIETSLVAIPCGWWLSMKEIEKIITLIMTEIK
ncbi:DegT/DnrJ/EryC1/StrS family aminotransferase [Buttiauxella massiliensis]|uniref:DegT/DnrJ/EryC1/StrS family aminotransferase n=1 Tax=Buttiauxella massiliensis TaxID=2831590 RepID=UPI00125F9104|nr:DegT/DnrJ/EryC1/StrS family aminotransferase [Buttiauxella massiliensis]